MHEAKNVRQAVAALGGGGAVGRLTETSRFAVHNWVKRDQFPGQHYVTLQEAARANGLHIRDDLFARVLVHPRDIKAEALQPNDPSISPTS